MNTLKPIPYILFFLLIISCNTNEAITQNDTDPETESIYFPQINSSSWDTKSISDLNWNANQVQPLLDYLEEKNTKGFIILHNGKIVLENYFNNHSATSNWYWASAGKTLTTTVSGIAQDQGLINLNTKVSSYLGTGWTSASLEKENLITCKNLLSMTSGLDDSIGDSNAPEDLHYVANAGERWAYHNVFLKMQDVVSQASNQTWSNYFNEKLRNRIGMTGNWISSGDLNLYWSNTRSMARFGLLVSANGKWENTQIVSETFLNEATTTSQSINEAYGYLWWLNGKTSFHLPQTQFEFNGELIPNAPEDLIAALGANDQKIHIAPSKKLVIIRMGQESNANDSSISFDNELWEKLNLLIN